MSEDHELDKALQEVGALMRKLRPDPKNEKAVTYTQETHTAFRSLIALSFANIATLTARLKALEHCTKQLEAKGLEFCGTYQRGLEYRRGQAVISHGSLFIAKQLTTEAPDGSAEWALAARKGRDGKDIRDA